MDKRRLFFNKMMLGDLRLGELRQIVSIRGEYTIGKHWMPIAKVRKIKNHLGIWMEDLGSDPNILICLDDVVKVDGRCVRIDVNRHNILGGCFISEVVELKIMLYDDPFPKQE